MYICPSNSFWTLGNKNGVLDIILYVFDYPKSNVSTAMVVCNTFGFMPCFRNNLCTIYACYLYSVNIIGDIGNDIENNVLRCDYDILQNTGADLGLLAGGKSVVVICCSTYEPGGGEDGTIHVLF